MILQALTEYYQTLANQGEISPPGWRKVKVAYALCIKADGSLEQVISIQTQQQMGNKTVLAPQLIKLPAPVKRASGIAANFLCDNSSYLLGVDNKGKPQRALNCFEACKKLHEKLLEQIDSPAARATLAFFKTGIQNKPPHILSSPTAWTKSSQGLIWYSGLMESMSTKTL